TSMLGRTIRPAQHRLSSPSAAGTTPRPPRSLRLLLARRPEERAAGPHAAVAVVGHTLRAVLPIPMLPLIEPAARAIAAIAVVRHALAERLLLRHGGGDGQSGHGQRDTQARKGEQASDHGRSSFSGEWSRTLRQSRGPDYCP